MGALPAELARPCMVMSAPNGARRTKADHPMLPLSATELADTAEACAEAGAAAIHVHARDAAGEHTLDPAACLDVLDALRARVGERLALQLTTEAAGRYEPAQQMALVRAIRPPAVSIAVRELIPVPAGETSAAEFLRSSSRLRSRPSISSTAPPRCAPSKVSASAA
jgi:uncharacterized protein (DUF849 family)